MSLTISQNYTLTDRAFVHLNNLPNLCSLKLEKCVSLSNQALMELDSERLANLHSLIITECRLGDQAMAHIVEHGGLPNVQVLELNYCSTVSDVIVESIRTFPAIKRLSLAGCSEFHGVMLSELYRNSELRILDISHSGVNDDGLRTIACVTQLRTLVCTNLKLSDRGLMGVNDLWQLRYLDISACVRITEHGLSRLHGCVNLETLRITACPRLQRFQSLFVPSAAAARHEELLMNTNGGSLRPFAARVIHLSFPATASRPRPSSFSLSRSFFASPPPFPSPSDLDRDDLLDELLSPSCRSPSPPHDMIMQGVTMERSKSLSPPPHAAVCCKPLRNESAGCVIC